MAHPDRMVVGHPFNPVYLLPLVEVCPGETDVGAGRLVAVYTAVGMHPLVLRKEVDGFVADRLLEALWREALWLVQDGVATVSEIDDAIRYGAGLRWASMGTMLTYRIAGGEGGMRHFLAQFGPALQWPWTHLTDVPELTDELLDRIAEQSDAQADGASVRELERLRDRCLVAVLQGLRTISLRGGEVLAEYDRSCSAAARPPPRHRCDHRCSPTRVPDSHRLGRLQRSHQRQPLRPTLVRCRRHVPSPHRHGCGVPPGATAGSPPRATSVPRPVQEGRRTAAAGPPRFSPPRSQAPPRVQPHVSGRISGRRRTR